MSSTPTAGPLAARFRGFGPLGILSLIVIVLGGNLLGTVLVLLWVALTGTPWRDIGYVRARDWVRIVPAGIALGVLLKFAMKAIVMPLLGGPPANPAFQYLVGNDAALPGTLLLILVGAGFGEETIWRGFLFERIGRLVRPGLAANVTSVLVSSVLFGLAHLSNQGLPGAEQAVVVGLVLGTIYALDRRLWLPMVVHAAFDVTAVLMIHGGYETRVAHWFFK